MIIYPPCKYGKIADINGECFPCLIEAAVTLERERCAKIADNAMCVSCGRAGCCAYEVSTRIRAGKTTVE